MAPGDALLFEVGVLPGLGVDQTSSFCSFFSLLNLALWTCVFLMSIWTSVCSCALLCFSSFACVLVSSLTGLLDVDAHSLILGFGD